MAQNRRTITRDSVFRRVGPTDAPKELPPQGVTLTQPPTRQTAVWLADEEVEWLDSRIHEVKRAGWRTLTRSAFIRSLIRAAMENAPDLRGVSGEQELTERLGTKS